MNHPIRVLVDLSHLHPDGLSGGIKPALLEMLRWMSSNQNGLAIHFVHVVKADFEPEVAPFLRPVDRLLAADQVQPRDLAARESCDVVYCPFGSTAFSCPGIPTLTLIVDLLHRDFPESIIPDEQAMRERWFQDAMLRTDRFQVISDYTARQLTTHYGVEADRMFRTYLPLQQRLARLGSVGKTTSREAFFYYPANAWAHKNHSNLLQAYADYRRTEGQGAWRLVLTGADDARMGKVRKTAAELGLSACVDFLGYVSEVQLAELWTQAGALVFPSLHEGFGIPLVEAMAYGVPILGGNTTAIPEIVGSAALLVDPRRPSELAAAMARIAADSDLRRTLVESGYRQLERFSPDLEFGRLQQALVDVARHPAKWRTTGYYAVDGVTDPEAVFGLPRPLRPGVLRGSTLALPADRTMQFWCGANLVGETTVPAMQTVEFRLDFTPKTAVLCIRVPNARSLSPSDPRIHGARLETLVWEDDNVRVNLLTG